MRLFFDTQTVHGWVERQLLGPDGKPKYMFAPFKLWHFFYYTFGLDIRLNFITGVWTRRPVRSNTITTRGKQKIAELMGGTDTNYVEYIAIGTSTPTSTALRAEITNGGGARAEANVSNVTTTTTGDTEQWQVSWSFTLAKAITEEGLFDASSSGNMLASQTFPVVNVEPNDIFSITHKIKIT